jgi:acyl-CoA thioester hydrolase
MNIPETNQQRVYTHEFVVQPTEIDAMGHVNNVVYLKWVQDAAEAHWINKASEDIRNRFRWVVLRHEIDYLSPAFEGQSIVATTWVDNFVGVKSDRIVELKLKESDKVIAKARTTWCLVDSTTMRPKRIDGEIIEVFGRV